jgi:hypothetical protein
MSIEPFGGLLAFQRLPTLVSVSDAPCISSGVDPSVVRELGSRFGESLTELRGSRNPYRNLMGFVIADSAAALKCPVRLVVAL